MKTTTLRLTDLPELSDESVTDILDFLYALMTAFENRYFDQLRRYQRQQAQASRPDLFEERGENEEVDDELPFF